MWEWCVILIIDAILIYFGNGFFKAKQPSGERKKVSFGIGIAMFILAAAITIGYALK